MKTKKKTQTETTRIKEIIKKARREEGLILNSYTEPNDYSTAIYGLDKGYLTRKNGIYSATQKGIDFLSSKKKQRKFSEKLTKILTDANKGLYTATEDYGRSVAYAKNKGWIRLKRGHQRKYYEITKAGAEKLETIVKS